MGRRGRRKIEPNDDWELLVSLFEWPEQRDYEELRPVTLFGASVPKRAGETGTPERTLYRKVERFERDGMLSLFALDEAGWLTALKLEGYGPRRASGPMALQEVLFPYLDVL